MSNNRRRYIKGFDGLRTIGVLGVIMYHINPELFSGGYLGVPIFFCISGYLITDQIMASYNNGVHYSLKNFYLKRLKRIYPGLVLMMMASSSYIVLFQRNLLHNLHQIFITNILNIYNWWQIANGQSYFERFANNESPFTHLWTLSIEGQFYIIWPLLMMFLLRKKVKQSDIFFLTFILSLVSALMMAVVYKPGVDPSRVYYGTDTRAFSILLGCALGIVWPSAKLKEIVAKKDKYLMNISGAISIVIMMWLMFFMKATSMFMYYGGMFIFSILTMVIVAIVAHPAAIWNKVLSNKLFSYIGSRSYGLYLWQFPVMIFFESKFTNIADHPVLYPVIEVAIIFLLTELAFRYVEKPFSRFNMKKVKESLFNFKSLKNISKTVVGVCSIILVLGSVGLVQAVNAPAPKANSSKLAKNIQKNKKANDRNNKKLLEELKKNKQKKSDKLDEKHYKELAKSHPVNKEFEKYGLTQIELQKAQKISAFAIGDSVMVDGSEDLKKIFPNMIVDASVSRQLVDCIDIIQNYKDQGTLANVMLVGLGTNGPITTDQIDQVMKIAGKSRHVYWINTHVPTRSWEKSVNAALKVSDEKYKNLKVIDWYSYSQNHESWFYDDQVHPNIDGSNYYATFISKEILKNER